MNLSKSEMENNHPIDLSRRSDSVETRKTPSPYNSSSFNETSPSSDNDSPTTLKTRKISILPYKRSATPTGRYQTNNYMPNGLQHDYQHVNHIKPERITPSPPENHQTHHRYIPEIVQPLINSRLHVPNGIDQLNLLAAQRKFINAPSMSGSSSPETEVANKLQPMDWNCDRKQSRPFKMYTKDSLSLGDTISAVSSEKYDVFRQQMLNRLYPNGEAIVNNPKMRRISHKSYNDSEISEMDYNSQQEQNEQMNNNRCGEREQQNESTKNDGNPQSDSSSSGASNGNASQVKDSAYFERRRKNNAAAKKSRDRRREKEDNLAIRAAYLERENLELKYELAALKSQLKQHLGV